MLTSHAYQSSHDHFNQGGMYHQENSENSSKPQLEGATTKIMNPSPTCGDPFNEGVQSVGTEGSGPTGLNNSPSHQFGGDDEFDTMGINIPSSALEEQQQGHQGGGGYNNYHQHQMAHHHQQHQQQWQQHHHHQMQQQQWHQQGQYMSPNGYGHGYDQYGYGDYGQMYAQGGGHSHGAPQGMSSGNGSVVGMGGPSPVGSHNTPSPQGAHSEDSVLGGGSAEDHIRNNNILKRPSPGSGVAGVPGNPVGVVPGANNMHPGVMHHSHQGVVHQMGHHHPHHHGPMTSPYHMHGHSQHQIPPPGMPVAKKPKVSKRKKKRDPNEPSKPVSAYALFFRDSQASIKVANPNAAFGDVSKIVASLWDALDPDSKAAYKKRTENAKKDYLKKLASYRASLVSKGNGDSGIGYGYYGYSDVMQSNGIHPSHKYMGSGGVSNQTGTGVGQSSSSYMGQPIPPRPPMQHGQAGALSNAHLHHSHGNQGAYMMQGQMQNGGMMGGQSPHSGHPHGGVPHSSMSQHSPMDNNSHLHNQAGGANSLGVGGPIHSPNGGSTSSGSSSGQTPLNTPTSASISSSSPNGCAASHANKSSQHQQGTASSAPGHGKQCGRPGCNNLVQRSPEGWTEEFCSNECVVGQCKEVYTSWSSGSNPVNSSGTNGPPPNPYSSPTAPPVK